VLLQSSVLKPMNLAKQTLGSFVSVLVVCVSANAKVRGVEPSARQELYAAATDDELEALVAPIALYPDPLVAQVLGAATYPDQVVEADMYVRANLALRWEELIKGAEERAWDPSVTALVQFSGVLNKLAKNIVWTSTLGEAAANQQSDVMAAIQRMRAKALAVGNLKSGERIKVVQESPNAIVIQPVNPKMIYVPSFNSGMVYGTAVTTPSYSAGDIASSAAISFGLGVAVGSPLRSPSCGWRYGYWRINWADRTIRCGSGIYLGNPYWWGGYYPGFYPEYRQPFQPEVRPPKPPPGWSPPTSFLSTKCSKTSGQPSKPGASTNVPTRPDGPGMTTTRPGPGVPNARPSAEELRGYPVGGNAKPPAMPNAFSGTVGGRAESARGNRSLNGATASKSSEAQQ
jgi:hypothetical protein